jgi:hypothetical protein
MVIARLTVSFYPVKFANENGYVLRVSCFAAEIFLSIQGC